MTTSPRSAACCRRCTRCGTQSLRLISKYAVSMLPCLHEILGTMHAKMHGAHQQTAGHCRHTVNAFMLTAVTLTWHATRRRSSFWAKRLHDLTCRLLPPVT